MSLLTAIKDASKRTARRILRPALEYLLEDAKVPKMRVVDLAVGEHSLVLHQEYIRFLDKGTLAFEGQITGDPSTGRLYGYAGAEETIAWLSDVGGGGLGPGTVRRVAMFDPTTTNVEDSSLQQDVSGNLALTADLQVLPNLDGECELGTPSLRFRHVAATALITGDLLLRNTKNGTRLRLVEGSSGELFLLHENSREVFRVLTERTTLTPDDLDLLYPLDTEE